MANEQNLKPRTTLTSEEAKKMGRNGGIASGKARQEKATMRKTLEMLLDCKSKKGETYRELATLGLIEGAIKGNAQNYKTILETIGELQVTSDATPSLKIEVVDNTKIVGEKEDE